VQHSLLHRANGFTLLEVMLALGILMLFAMAAMQMVRHQAIATEVYLADRAATEEVESFIDLLHHTLAEIHLLSPGAFLGQATGLDGRPSDTLDFRLINGPLLGFDNEFVPRAVRLRVDTVDGTPALLRESWNPDQVGASDHITEILSTHITGFDARYYDPRINSWVENWVDQTRPPTLVRIDFRTSTGTITSSHTIHLPPLPYRSP